MRGTPQSSNETTLSMKTLEFTSQLLGQLRAIQHHISCSAAAGELLARSMDKRGPKLGDAASLWVLNLKEAVLSLQQLPV